MKGKLYNWYSIEMHTLDRHRVVVMYTVHTATMAS